MNTAEAAAGLRQHGPPIELEKFWPLSLKPLCSSALETEHLYLELTCCMQKKRIKALETRSIQSIQNP